MRFFSGDKRGGASDGAPVPFDPTNYAYRAFISYARTDRDFVDDLYSRLTKYRTPEALSKQRGAFGHPPRSLRIFLDRKSVEAGGSVPESIRNKIKSSAFLIVFCSKHAKDRYWVNEEIKTFLEDASAERIIPVYLRDNRDTPLPDIVPPPLLALDDNMPVGADLVVDGGITVVRDKVIGGLIGFSQDQIAREQERQDKKDRNRARMVIAAITTLFFAACLAGVAAYNARNDALVSESRVLARSAVENAVNGEPARGMLLALEGLPAGQGTPPFLQRPLEPRALGALAASMFWQGERRILTDPEGNWRRRPEFAVSADGSAIAVSMDSRIRIIDAATYQDLAERTLPEDDGAVRTIAFSPDGDLIAIGTMDGAVTVLNRTLDEEKFKHREDRRSIAMIRFRPDASEILVSASHQPFVLDIDTGERKHTLVGHERNVQSVDYSADGQWIVTNAGDRSVRFWDADTGEQVGVITTEAHMGFYKAVADPDFAYAVTTSRHEFQYHLQVWSIPEGALVKSVSTRSLAGEMREFDLSPDGSLIAAREGAEIALRKLEDLSEARRIRGHGDEIFQVRFSNDGEHLATTSGDLTMRIWNVASGRELGRFRNAQFAFRDPTFTADGGGVVAKTNDGVIHAWSAPPTAPVGLGEGHVNVVNTVEFSPDGAHIVTASDDFSVRLWDANTGALVRVMDREAGHFFPAKGAVFSPDGKYVVSHGEDNAAIVWDVATGGEVQAWGATNSMWDARFSPDSKRVVLAEKDGSAGVFDLESGEAIALMEGHEEGVRGARFSPDGSKVLTWSGDETVRLWDAATGELLITKNTNLNANAVFADDGTSVIAMGFDMLIRFDAETGETLMRYGPHNGVVWNAVLTPDGKRMATASRDSTAVIWEVETGVELLRLRGEQRDLTDVAISPDGKYVATTASFGGSPVVLWDVDTGQRVAAYDGQGATVMDVEFAPWAPGEPMRFATAGADNTVAIWSAPRSIDDNSLVADACRQLAAEDRVLTPSEAGAVGVPFTGRSPCAAAGPLTKAFWDGVFNKTDNAQSD